LKLIVYKNELFTAILWDTPEALNANLSDCFKEKKMWQWKDKPLKWFEICYKLILKFAKYQKIEEVESGNLAKIEYEAPEELITILKRIDALNKLSLIDNIPEDIINEETLEDVDNVLATVLVVDSIKK